MNPSYSIYLDVVRFLAACLVYLYHSNQRWLIKDILPISHYGHAAVIVFFVLSGFVIAWVTDRKERDWPTYAAARLSRVFSVVVPALVLCFLLDGIGRHFWDKPYDSYPFNNFLLRLGGSLLMLNEVWFVSITSLSNVPFWSITYEFWYYMLFAVVTFVRGPQRWWIAGGMLLLLGPKIALLAPIWACGVLLYRWRALERIPLVAAWVMVIASTALIIGLHVVGFFDTVSKLLEPMVGERWYRELTFSKFFLGDYLLMGLVFCNFAGMRVVAPQMSPLFSAISIPVKWLAGYTFTLYLLHQPLFLFWGAVLHGDPNTSKVWWMVTALTALSVVGIGQLTEHRREAFRLWLQGHFLRIEAQRSSRGRHA